MLVDICRIGINLGSDDYMNKHSFWFKVALLSIATLTNAAAAVQVTVPLIHQTLAGHSQTDIELLMSVSSLGILIFVL